LSRRGGGGREEGRGRLRRPWWLLGEQGRGRRKRRPWWPLGEQDGGDASVPTPLHPSPAPTDTEPLPMRYHRIPISESGGWAGGGGDACVALGGGVCVHDHRTRATLPSSSLGCGCVPTPLHTAPALTEQPRPSSFLPSFFLNLRPVCQRVAAPPLIYPLSPLGSPLTG